MPLAAWAALFGLHTHAQADEIDRYIERERSVYQIPAVVVGVIRAGKLVDSRAIGQANVELAVAASAQHVFEIGSISKQFTAYAILILSERRSVDLNAAVGKYLPELPPSWRRPTLHQLLSHTSGLPDLEEAFGYGVYRETPSDEAFLARLLTLPIESEPGKKWNYSNTNYWLLARVIERVSDLSYAKFMQTEIFTPLGMSSTRSALPSQVLRGRAAGYDVVNDTLENRDATQPSTARGLGDIATTLADMARWEQEQRVPRLLAPETAQLARQAAALNDGSLTKYGYGWFLEQTLPSPVLRHDGGTSGFTAEYLRVPALDLAVVVLSNCFCAPAAMAVRIARLAEPQLRGPSIVAATNADPRQAQRVRDVVSTAVRAQSEWREEWFTADVWRQMKPYLSDIESTYRRRGALRSVTPVGPDGVQDPTKPAYRAVFEKMTRLMTIEFDETGRIKSLQNEDE